MASHGRLGAFSEGEASGGSTSGVSGRTGSFLKTKMCKFQMWGSCSKGVECKFAHSAEELSPLPDLRCTKMCRSMMITGRCTVMGCTYAHSVEELRSAEEAVGGLDFEAQIELAREAVQMREYFKNQAHYNYLVMQAGLYEQANSAWFADVETNPTPFRPGHADAVLPPPGLEDFDGEAFLASCTADPEDSEADEQPEQPEQEDDWKKLENDAKFSPMYIPAPVAPSAKFLELPLSIVANCGSRNTFLEPSVNEAIVDAIRRPFQELPYGELQYLLQKFVDKANSKTCETSSTDSKTPQASDDPLKVETGSSEFNSVPASLSSRQEGAVSPQAKSHQNSASSLCSSSEMEA